MREVPLYRLGGSVHVELIPDIDEVLNGGHVHIVDRGEIENDGSKKRQVRAVRLRFTLARARVVPWTVTRRRVGEGVGATGMLEDGLDQVIGVVVGVGIVESFRESIDEDTRERLLHFHLGIRSVVVVNGKIDGPVGLVLVI